MNYWYNRVCVHPINKAEYVCMQLIIVADTIEVYLKFIRPVTTEITQGVLAITTSKTYSQEQSSWACYDIYS